MKRQSILVLVILTSTTISSADLIPPSYYTFGGNVSHFSVSPSGSTDLLTQQGINVGDYLSFTFLIDFSREGEYIRNNGDVWIQPEGLYTFYADIVDVPEVLPINGGWFNGPLDIASRNRGWVSDDYNNGTYRASIILGTGNVWYHLWNHAYYPTQITEWKAGEYRDLRVCITVYDNQGNSAAAHMTVGQFDSITPVPVPSAVILGSIGLTFSGWLLKRRKRL